MLCNRRRACRVLIIVKQNSIHTGHCRNFLTIDDILLIKNPMRKNKINKKRKRTKCIETHPKQQNIKKKNTKKIISLVEFVQKCDMCSDHN
jgi:hypothetical protein